MLVLLAATAHAYTLVRDCHGLAPVDTVPTRDADRVPVDVRPAVVFDHDACDQRTAWTTTLHREDGTLVETTLGDGSDDPETTSLVELFPVEPLDAEGVYRLKIVPAELETFGTEVAFRTGTETVQGIEHPPELREVDATWSNRDNRITVDVKIAPATDWDHLSVLQVRDSAAERVVHTFREPTSGFLETSFTWADEGRPAEVCPQVRAIDGAGVPTEWEEAVCTPVGCSAVGSGASLGALALAGLAAARRRTVLPVHTR